MQLPTSFQLPFTKTNTVFENVLQASPHSVANEVISFGRRLKLSVLMAICFPRQNLLIGSGDEFGDNVSLSDTPKLRALVGEWQ